MGYKLNSEAYEIFTQIEVGIREFLISVIRGKGVNEWTQDFLGKVQLESLKDVGKRIFEADQKEQLPNIEDIYIVKANRAINTSNETFAGSKLCHPFYYLGWSDIISLMGKSSNSNLISDIIGKLNREVVIGNLKALNYLRNDIAHSRFITENDFQFIKGAFDQISGVIPNFFELYNYQSTEDRLGILMSNLEKNTALVENCTMLEMSEILRIESCIDDCANSFWINSIFPGVVKLLIALQTQIKLYKILRETPGGLLNIQKWRRDNSELLANLKNVINERKI